MSCTSGAFQRRDEAKFFPMKDSCFRWMPFKTGTEFTDAGDFTSFSVWCPSKAAAAALRFMLSLIADFGMCSFLAVLKTMGAHGRGYLSFPHPGFTLALDFPNGPGSPI